MKRMTTNARRMASASVVAIAWFSGTAPGYAQTVAPSAGTSQVDTTQAAPSSTVVAAAPAQAATAAPSSASEQHGLGEIVVTAQRREQALSKVPISVQAVSDKQLAVANVETTASLVQASPSVAFTGGFSANSSGFVIRGISSESSEGGLQQSTEMVIDGVPLARPGEFLGDLGDVERVEILRGPQGTLFGKNATAGVINIITKRPTDKYEGYLEGSLATGGEVLTRAMLNVPITDSIRARFNGYYGHLDPLVHNEGPGNDAYGYKRYGFSGKVDADITDTVTLKLTGDYRRAHSTFGQALDIVPSTGIGAAEIAALGFTPERGLIRSNTDARNFDSSTGYSITGELGWAISDKLKLTAISGYRDFKDDNQSDVDDTPAGFDAGVGFQPNPAHYPVMYVDVKGPRQPQHVNYFSQEVRLNYSSDRLNAVGGIFYQTLKDRGAGVTPFIFDGAYVLQNPTLAGTYFYSATNLAYRIKDNTYAGFGDATYKLTDTISAFGGLRYTHETINLNYASDTYFSPVAIDYGAIILPGPNGQPSISTATGRSNLTPISTVDYQTSKPTNNLSGRAGVQWQPSSATNFYFSYNRGYKGPAADVSRGSAAPDPTTGYSPLLKPELASSFELGTKLHLLDNNVQLSLNLFDEKIKNLQQAIVLPSTVTQLINAGNVKTKGVEFEGRARVVQGLTFDVGVTYTDPKYSGNIFVGCYPGQTLAQGCVVQGAGTAQSLNGAQTVNSYKWRYDLGGTYTTPLGASPLDLTVHVGWDWFSSSPQRVDTDPAIREPSHGLLDATVTLAHRTGKWYLQAFGKNLTNNFYYGSLVNVDNTISRVSGYINRDYKRYVGLKFSVGF